MVRKAYPSEVGFVKDLYSTPFIESTDTQWLEKEFFQRIDSMAAKCLVKMLQSPPQNLDNVEQSAWSVFIHTLYHRSPEALRSTQSQGMRIWQKTLRNIGSRYQQLKTDEDPDFLEDYIASHTDEEIYDYVLRHFPNTMMSERVGQFLNDLQRIVIDIDNKVPNFLISDAIPIRTNGLANRGGHYAIPLSPTRLLVAAHEYETLKLIKGLSAKELVTSVNTWIVERARRFVGSTDCKQDRFIRNRFGRSPIDPVSGPLPDPSEWQFH